MPALATRSVIGDIRYDYANDADCRSCPDRGGYAVVAPPQGAAPANGGRTTGVRSRPAAGHAATRYADPPDGRRGPMTRAGRPTHQ